MLSGNHIEREVKEMVHFLWDSHFVYSTSLCSEENVWADIAVNIAERQTALVRQKSERVSQMVLYMLYSTVRYVWTGLGGQHQERDLAFERRFVNCTGSMVTNGE